MKLEITTEIEVDDGDFNDWKELVFAPDLFSGSYCGYWLQGVDNNPERGWLALEESVIEGMGRRQQDIIHAQAVACWGHGPFVPLPAGYLRMDAAFCRRAWVEGVKRFGADWYTEGDSDTYDTVVQLTLLGEVRYG